MAHPMHENGHRNGHDDANPIAFSESGNQVNRNHPSVLSLPSDKKQSEQDQLTRRNHHHHHHFMMHRRKNSESIERQNNLPAADPRSRRTPPVRLRSFGNSKALDEAGVYADRSPVQQARRQSSPMRWMQARQSHDISREGEWRRASLPGAKPVAPSWHPDAPDGLRVQSPGDAVLLPELPIAGMSTSHDKDADAAAFLEERVKTSSVPPPKLETEKVIESETIKLQRPSIKVRIITWNQGNSVPKGDLGVLLGRVGEYIAPEAGWDESSDEEEEKEDREGAEPLSSLPTKGKSHRGMGVAGQEGIPRKDRIPPLPHDDAHPYHVIVIAGQECPWGDGKRISTGVGMAGELGDLSRSKSRAAKLAKEAKAKEREKEKEKSTMTTKEEEKEKNKSEGNQTDSNVNSAVEPGPKTPGVLVTGDEDPFSHAIPLTPGGVTKARSGGRGWSEMCEDWLCRGPLAQATATKGLALASTALSNPPSGLQSPEEGSSPLISRSPSPLPLFEESGGSGDDREMVRIVASASAHDQLETPTKRVSLAVPKRVLRTMSSRTKIEPTSHLASPVVRGEDLGAAEQVLSPSHSSPPTRPDSPIKQTIDDTIRSSNGTQTPLRDLTKKNAHHHRLAVRIPGLSGAHHVTVQSDGTPLSLGAYELVCKERCYMMYTAVYVWRGCLDRVRGTSQGHVKSGLLAGRVGNKGAVGISLHLGQSRLLFVNAHLAAHEGKVAERIANVEKIKKELKVDTFLPPDDPRNSEDDVTSCFDQTFWFGDLNFRVDITRRHADWLMMKKQYDHALAFDQLGKVMKEQPTIFTSFKEAPITFPPTFKFDVLKTIKIKRQMDEKARKLKAAGMAHQFEEGLGDLSFGEGQQATSPIAASSSGHTIPDDRAEDDASSISSAVHSNSASNLSEAEEISSNPSSPDFAHPTGVRSANGDDIVAQNTAAAEGLGLHSRAIKTRRRLLGLVRSAVGAISSQTTKEDNQRLNKQDLLEREQSRLSSSSHASGYSSAISGSKSPQRREGQSPPPNGLQASKDSPVKNVNGAAEPIPFQPFAFDPHGEASRSQVNIASYPDRRPSVVAFESDVAGGDDKQMYDTSAKQRVPSWCDRVLWRSNVAVPALDDGRPKDQSDEGQGLLSNSSRIGAKFSNAVSRLHHNRHDSATPVVATQSPNSAARAGDDVQQANTTPKMNGREVSVKDDDDDDALRNSLPPLPARSTTDALTTSPRRKWFNRRMKQSVEGGEKPPTVQRANTMAALDQAAVRTGSFDTPKLTKRTKSTTDVPTAANRSESMDDLVRSVDRSSESLVKPRKSQSASGRRTSFNFEWPRKHKMSNPTLSPLGRREDLTPTETFAQSSGVRESNNESGIKSVVRPSTPPRTNRQMLRSSTLQPQTHMAADSPRRSSRWADILTHLSPLVIPPGSSVANALANFGFRSTPPSTVTPTGSGGGEKAGQDEPMLIGPRRGEVECLLYKSLNDREMRLLEGRSDHRPVIFVGSIGIGRSRTEQI